MAHSMKRFQGICESLEEKAGVSASANVLPPPSSRSLGRRKTASGGKVGGWTAKQGGVVRSAWVLTATKWNIHLP